MRSSQAKFTDFYGIVPVPGTGDYVLLIDNIPVGVHSFPGLDEAEEYVLYNYNSLKGEAEKMKEQSDES